MLAQLGGDVCLATGAAAHERPQIHFCGKACVSVLSIGSCDTHECNSNLSRFPVGFEMRTAAIFSSQTFPRNEHVVNDCARRLYGLVSLSFW